MHLSSLIGALSSYFVLTNDYAFIYNIHSMKMELSSGLAGVAGEYFVAAELSRHGFIASVTLRNSKGIDILATTEDAAHTISIQVKTNQIGRTTWVLNEKAEKINDPTFYYVFVKLNEAGILPDFYIVPSAIVSKQISESHHEWLTTPGKKGQSHNPSTMRKFSLEADSIYYNNWALLFN